MGAFLFAQTNSRLALVSPGLEGAQEGPDCPCRVDPEVLPDSF